MYHEMYFIIPRETWHPVDLLITSLRKAEKNFNERVLRSDLRQFQNLLQNINQPFAASLVQTSKLLNRKQTFCIIWTRYIIMFPDPIWSDLENISSLIKKQILKIWSSFSRIDKITVVIKIKLNKLGKGIRFHQFLLKWWEHFDT